MNFEQRSPWGYAAAVTYWQKRELNFSVRQTRIWLEVCVKFHFLSLEKKYTSYMPKCLKIKSLIFNNIYLSLDGAVLQIIM